MRVTLGYTKFKELEKRIEGSFLGPISAICEFVLWNPGDPASRERDRQGSPDRVDQPPVR